jgi:hypothetical protein
MLTICVAYKDDENIREWRESLPKEGLQIVACRTKIDPTITEVKKEIIGITEQLVGLQITFPSMENHFDFSLVRNYLDEYATGDWILHIDSDERLAIPEDELWDIIKTLRSSEADCAFISIAGVSHEEEPTEPYRPRYNLPNIRLHRRSSKLKWTGICHETIDIEGKEITIADTDILLYHKGYAIEKEKMLEKCERNAKLMIREYTREQSQRNWNYLVNTFHLIYKLTR